MNTKRNKAAVVLSFPCSLPFLALSPLHPEVDEQDYMIQYDTDSEVY